MWDMAAPAAILFAAGGQMYRHDGDGVNVAPMDFSEITDTRVPPFITGHLETLQSRGLLGNLQETAKSMVR